MFFALNHSRGGWGSTSASNEWLVDGFAALVRPPAPALTAEGGREGGIWRETFLPPPPSARGAKNPT